MSSPTAALREARADLTAFLDDLPKLQALAADRAAKAETAKSLEERLEAEASAQAARALLQRHEATITDRQQRVAALEAEAAAEKLRETIRQAAKAHAAATAAHARVTEELGEHLKQAATETRELAATAVTAANTIRQAVDQLMGDTAASDPGAVRRERLELLQALAVDPGAGLHSSDWTASLAGFVINAQRDMSAANDQLALITNPASKRRALGV